eukprot:166537-Alexandrium_andersonii.AAC.1
MRPKGALAFGGQACFGLAERGCLAAPQEGFRTAREAQGVSGGRGVAVAPNLVGDCVPCLPAVAASTLVPIGA